MEICSKENLTEEAVNFEGKITVRNDQQARDDQDPERFFTERFIVYPSYHDQMGLQNSYEINIIYFYAPFQQIRMFVNHCEEWVCA